MANSFKSYPVAGVTTETTVYTGPSSTQTTVIGATIANTTASNITCSLTFTSGATTVYLVKDATILPGGALVPIGGDQKVVVEAADTIKVSASGAVDVLLSVLEVN